MDEYISRWIMEFLLRHSTSDQLINKALSKLPVSNHDFRFKKAVLLRTVQSEISEASVSETVLECLETIAYLDAKEGLRVVGSLKAAYCAVAVECTVKYLGLGGGDERFLEALKRVWRDKVSIMLAAGKELVATGEVARWRDDIETAVLDVSVRRRLGEMNTRNNALRLVRVYLGEAWAVMGPPFLELAVARLRQLKEKESEGDGGGGKRAVAMEKGKGILKENLLTKRKHIACHRRVRGPVRITDNEESGSDASCGKYDTVSTPEVNKVKEALKSSSFELHAIVKDPLPSALRQAEAVISDIARGTQNQDQLMETQHAVPNQEPPVETRNNGEHEPNPSSNVNVEPVQASENSHRNPMPSCEPSVEERNDVARVPNPSSNANVERVQANENNYGNPSCSNQNNMRKPSFMERNSTACTYEWDDLIDDSPGGPSNHTNRFHLPSPKRKVVSPLRKYEVAKLSRRRKKKRWSLEEEEALRKGVQELGRGNWKLILTSNPAAFCERTEVDLKDKWRNMTRY